MQKHVISTAKVTRKTAPTERNSTHLLYGTPTMDINHAYMSHDYYKLLTRTRGKWQERLGVEETVECLCFVYFVRFKNQIQKNIPNASVPIHKGGQADPETKFLQENWENY